MLHLGSNVGDREGYLSAAKAMIQEMHGPLQESSAIYETAPWGLQEQESFLNQAILGRTKCSPFQFLADCKSIEHNLGRSKVEQWGPREIDIDIIFFDSFVVGTAELSIPHPYLHQRKFVLQPLADIIPHFKHPVLDQTIHQLYAECADTLSVEPYNQTSDV